MLFKTTSVLLRMNFSVLFISSVVITFLFILFLLFLIGYFLTVYIFYYRYITLSRVGDHQFQTNILLSEIAKPALSIAHGGGLLPTNTTRGCGGDAVETRNHGS